MHNKKKSKLKKVVVSESIEDKKSKSLAKKDLKNKKEKVDASNLKNEKFKTDETLEKAQAIIISEDDLETKKVKKKSKLSKVVIIILAFLIIIGLVYFGYRIYKRSEISKRINNNISIEYGEVLTLDYILKGSFEKVKVEPKLSSLKDVGEHEVTLTINGEVFKVKVNIKDTIAPELTVKDVQKYMDEDLPKVEEFVESVDDLSEVSLTMSKIEKTVGEHEVTITASDEYDNKTSKKAKLTIIEYKGSVTFSGLSNLSVEIGNKPDLRKNVSAKDDRFGDLEFTIDDSKVNYNAIGTYTIYYTVTDQLGNVSTRERKITIKAKTVMINNFPTYSQFPNYPNGCETIALYLMLKYYGVSVSPETLVNNLAKGEGVHWEGDTLYGGNPEIEFVGDPRDQHGYGVYQKPIISLASKYKSGMIDYTGHSLNQVLEIVRSGKPVQVWVSIDLRSTSVCTSWTHKASGKTINWICNLHSVVIVGFNDDYVYVSDPYTGDIERYSRSRFQSRYNQFGKRAIYFS